MKKVKSISKRLLVLGSILLVLLISVIFWADQKVVSHSKAFVHSNVDDVPYTKVALVLGTSPKLKNGRINLYFKHRIKAALDLYKAKKVQYFLLSGDNGSKYYNEPVDMKKALIKGGVPESSIFLDYAGFRTYDSVIRAHKVFDQDSILIVSQKFHNQRAIYIAQHFGITAHAYNAKDIAHNTTNKMFVREKLARVKVFLDLILQKQPKFLGKKVKIP